MATAPNLTVIPIEEFTEAAVNGSGVFDLLMKANKAHLEEEFTKSRLRGPEYATVYLGMLESTMQHALAFFIQQRKLGLEAELLEIQKQIAEVELAKARVDLEIAELTAQKVPVEIEVLRAQKCKLDAEYDVLLAQNIKVASETALLNQKVATEKAQTSSNSVDPDSVIGKQKALYQAQADGFKRDAEQKAAKLLADTWNVRRTTDEGTEANDQNLLYDPTIGRAIVKLLDGVGA